MKTLTRITAVVILAVMVLSLVACSSFGSIKSNFEKNGYVYLENEEGNSIFDSYTADLEEGEISCTFHVFKYEGKDEETEGDSSLGGLLGGLVDSLVDAVDYCGVIEFASDKDMEKALEESATLKGLIEDAQDSDLVKGNCILITGVVRIDEKIKIFNGEKVD